MYTFVKQALILLAKKEKKKKKLLAHPTTRVINWTKPRY